MVKMVLEIYIHKTIINTIVNNATSIKIIQNDRALG